MAFFTRTNILKLLAGVMLILGLLLVLSIGVVFYFAPQLSEEVFSASQYFWFNYEPRVQGLWWNGAGAVFLYIAGVILFLFARNFFRRSVHAEYFFLAIFAFSFWFESLRIISLVIFNLKLPLGLISFITRLIFSVRLLGLLAVFFTSLYLFDFQYQRFDFLFLLMLITSLILGFSLPLNQELVLSNGLARLLDEKGLFIIYFSFFLILFFNLALALQRGRHLLLILGIALLLISRELLFFILSPLSLGLSIAIFSGGAFCLYRDFIKNFALS